MIEIFEPGTHVTLCHNNTFRGHILSIEIKPKFHVLYEVEWWTASNDRMIGYFDEQFVVPVDDNFSSVKIGFK